MRHAGAVLPSHTSRAHSNVPFSPEAQVVPRVPRPGRRGEQGARVWTAHMHTARVPRMWLQALLGMLGYVLITPREGGHAPRESAAWLGFG